MTLVSVDSSVNGVFHAITARRWGVGRSVQEKAGPGIKHKRRGSTLTPLAPPSLRTLDFLAPTPHNVKYRARHADRKLFPPAQIVPPSPAAASRPCLAPSCPPRPSRRGISGAIWPPAGLQVACSLRALVEVSDEAAETVVRAELLAHQLEPRRGRDVVGLEPLLDGDALVRMAVYLFRICDGEG